MTAGRLREVVTFQRRSTVGDAYGNKRGDWGAISDDLTAVPAEIVPMRGGEKVLAEKLSGQGLRDINVRYSPLSASITEADRILDDRSGRVYSIRYIENRDKRRKFLTFTCEYGVASG